MNFLKAFQLAKLAAHANGRQIAVVKHLRSDEWTITSGQVMFVPDVTVTPQGEVRTFTMIGRRALAQAS